MRALVASGVRPVGPFRANSVGMRFAWIPPGTFLMGSPPSEPDRESHETQHTVTLTKGFWLGVHPVTQSQWRVLMDANPSHFKGDNLPVEQIAWPGLAPRGTVAPPAAVGANRPTVTLSTAAASSCAWTNLQQPCGLLRSRLAIAAVSAPRYITLFPPPRPQSSQGTDSWEPDVFAASSAAWTRTCRAAPTACSRWTNANAGTSA